MTEKKPRTTKDVSADIQELVTELKAGRDQLHDTTREYAIQRRQDKLKIYGMAFIILISLGLVFFQARANYNQLRTQEVNYNRGEMSRACAVFNIMNDNRLVSANPNHPVIDPQTLGLSCKPLPVK